MNGSTVTNGNSYSGTQYHSPAVFETDSLQKKKQTGKFFKKFYSFTKLKNLTTPILSIPKIIMVPGYIYSVTVAIFPYPKPHITKLNFKII